MRRAYGQFFAWTLSVAFVLGCGGEEEKKPPTPPPPAPKPAPKPEPPPDKPDKPDKPVEPVKKEEPVEQHLKLTLDGPIEHSTCVGTLAAGVLQIGTQEPGGSGAYPDVLFWSKVNAPTLKALEGQTISAQVFVQIEQDKPHWHTPNEALVQVKITKVTDDTLRGEIVSGKLRCVETDEHKDLTGTFGASFTPSG